MVNRIQCVLSKDGSHVTNPVGVLIVNGAWAKASERMEAKSAVEDKKVEAIILGAVACA